MHTSLTTRVSLSLTAKPIRAMSREEMVARAQRKPWPPKPETEDKAEGEASRAEARA